MKRLRCGVCLPLRARAPVHLIQPLYYEGGLARAHLQRRGVLGGGDSEVSGKRGLLPGVHVPFDLAHLHFGRCS